MSIQRIHTGLANKHAFRLLGSAFLLFSFAGVGAAQGRANDIKVARVSFPVTLADGGAANVVGYLGHDFNTHFRNQEGWRLMDEWLRSKGF